jgi:hypothetical protein
MAAGYNDFIFGDDFDAIMAILEEKILSRKHTTKHVKAHLQLIF